MIEAPVYRPESPASFWAAEIVNKSMSLTVDAQIVSHTPPFEIHSFVIFGTREYIDRKPAASP